MIEIMLSPGVSHILQEIGGEPDFKGYSDSRLTQEALKAAWRAGHSKKFVRPQPAPLTLTEAQAEVSSRIREQANSLRVAITGGISAPEAGSWPIKEAEARKVLAGSTDAPTINAEAKARKVPPLNIANRVLSHADAWRELEGQIAGASGYHRDQIAKLTTAEEVLAYDWSGGWPNAS